MDKQNQIKEMARICREHRNPTETCIYPESEDCRTDCELYNPDISCRWTKTATALYDAGYRKIQGAVVLTAEQFSDYLTLKDSHKNAVERCEKLQSDNERLYKNIGKFKDIVRKKTAEKFAKAVAQIICDNTYPYFDKDGKPVNIWKTVVGCDKIDEICKEITENKV
jgi:hypothetical protein